MQVFRRESTQTHEIEDGNLRPGFLGEVSLGERFVIETENGNDVNGPVRVRDVSPGEDVAIHIESIDIVDPVIAPNGGPIVGLPGFELEQREGYLYFPKHFRVKPRPALGNVAVLPEVTDELLAWAKQRGFEFTNWRRYMNDPRGRHCHQDCADLGPGAAIHMKCQVEGVGVCLGDFHARMGQGETAFNGISSAANVELRVERSEGWLVDWPLIETRTELMVCVSGAPYRDTVIEAFRSCRLVVAEKAGCSVEEANALVASAMDLRNGAIYGLEGYPGSKPGKLVSVTAVIPKDVFTA